MRFVTIHRPEASRIVTLVHVLTWRKTPNGLSLADTTIPRKLAALPSDSFYLALLWVAP
jgi:hypothetical protein